MKCGYCGNEVKDDAQFCSNCGHSIEEPSEEGNEPTKAEKGAYAASIIALLIVLALVGYGGFVIVYRDLHPQKSVSASDENNGLFNYDSTFTDSALVGKWQCTDRAAADYGDNNFGVEVKILLTLTGDGKFTLDYNMTDTGIPAKSLSTSGHYSTEDGMITFAPEEIPGMEQYLKRHGKRPSFQYAADGGRFALKYENGSNIIFTQVKD
jgi:hypothetical protein